MPSRPDPALLEQLARAVLQRRRELRRIEADNTGGELETLMAAVELAARQQIAYAGVVDAGMLAVDWDGGPLEQFAQICAEMLECGLDPVVVTSGREGHYHLFCPIGHPHDLLGWSDRFEAVGGDVRSDNNLIRPPGWPHRLGRPVALVSHSSWNKALAALNRLKGSPGPKQPGGASAAGLAGLPVRFARLLEVGDHEGRYRRADGTTDESRLVLAICSVAVLEGVGRETVYHLLSDRRLRGGHGLQRRLARRGTSAQNKAREWFDRTWAKANDRGPVRGPVRDRTEAVALICEYAELAARTSFPGATGATDRIVLAACHRIASSWGSLYVPLSWREVADRANIASKTAGRSLKRLRAAGWLRQVRGFKNDRAAVYAIDVPRHIAQNVPSASTHGGRVTGGMLRECLGHDAFHRFALGKGCLETLWALNDEGQTAKEIAEATGRHPGTVRRHLVKLAEAGLADVDDGSWVRRELDDLGELLGDIAEESGTTGMGARRHELFLRERRAYRIGLSRREERGELAARRRDPGDGTQLVWTLEGTTHAGRRAPPPDRRAA